METGSTSMDKISEALQLLDEVAQGEKSSIQSIIKDRYVHLKDAIIETQHSLEGSLSETKDKAFAAARHAHDYSVEKAKKIDEHVHEKPWAYIAGAAVFGLLTGYILGRNVNR